MKFGFLLKKELGGLINRQTIFSMIFTPVLLVTMGQVMGHAMDEGFDTSSVNICNMDHTEFTESVLANLEKYGSAANTVTLESDNYADELNRLGLKNVIVIPEGFSKTILEDKKPADIIFAGKLATGLAGNMSSLSASDAISAIEESASDELLLKTYGLSDDDVALIKNSDNIVEYTVANDKFAKVPQSMLTAVMMSQSMAVPFALFFMLMMASQMIMTAISNEKIDKTLETLLSAPVSRMTVLWSKMTAAFIVALMNAAVMSVGFILYILGIMGSAGEKLMSEASSMAVSPDVSGTMTDALSLSDALKELGMNIGAGGYAVMALQILLSTAIGLCIALILGAIAEDAQSLQTLLMPIMLLVMIPFLITMFADISSMNTGLRLIIGIIPFTHSYTAMTNIMMHDYGMLIGGLIYQILFLAGCMFFAVRLFNSDKLFTMNGKLSDIFKNNRTAMSRR